MLTRQDVKRKSAKRSLLPHGQHVHFVAEAMSIAITAPAKFDFQGIVCVEMMLHFADFRETRFSVEPSGGEDAELHLSEAALPSVVEIQVKGAAGAVTLAAVASCLARTPPRFAGNTLLERLIANPARRAVLVMSGRCDDEASIFVAENSWLGEAHQPSQMKRKDAEAFLKAFEVAEPTGTEGGPLKAARAAHNKRFAASARSMIITQCNASWTVLTSIGYARYPAPTMASKGECWRASG